MSIKRSTMVMVVAGLVASSTAHAERKKDLRAYVLKAVDEINAQWAGKGYDAAYFTHDLDWDKPGAIKAHAKKPKTMCVAAVAEVMIIALKMYVDETKDDSVYKRLPADSWNRGRPIDIRPYIWMFDNVKSDGTADAMQQFGIGEQVPFGELLPGDFINLNREKTGHAVVFLGFLNKKGEIEDKYDEKKVVGFKYFSSQSSGVAGLGYRWGYFDGFCPEKDPAKPRDCGIKRSSNQHVLNTGYLWHPTIWKTEAANKDRIDAAVRRLIDQKFPSRPNKAKLLSAKELERIQKQALELLSTEKRNGQAPPTYTGETTD